MGSDIHCYAELVEEIYVKPVDKPVLMKPVKGKRLIFFNIIEMSKGKVV